MPEELCQVSPKSHYGVLASHSDPSPSATELLNFWKKFLSICSYIKPLIELRTKFSKDFEREKVYGDLCGHSGWRRVVQGSRLSRYKLAHHLDYKFSIPPKPHASKFSFSSAPPHHHHQQPYLRRIMITAAREIASAQSLLPA